MPFNFLKNIAEIILVLRSFYPNSRLTYFSSEHLTNFSSEHLTFCPEKRDEQVARRALTDSAPHLE